MKWIDIPPVWLVAHLALSWGAARAGWADFTPNGFAVLWGAVLITAGGVLTALTVRAFAAAKTSVIPHTQPAALVTHGIMSVSRNPIYLADLLILMGMSLIWGSLIGILSTPVLAWILTRRFILPEEDRLRAAFPEEFDAYAARVRRW